MSDDHHTPLKDLCRALVVLDSEALAFQFLKDLCTPAELTALSERWQIAQALHKGLSYRDIHQKMGASLTTIGRVARFLKDEPYQGYGTVLTLLSTKSLDSTQETALTA